MRIDELTSPGQATTRMQGSNNATQPNTQQPVPQGQTPAAPAQPNTQEPKVPMGNDPQSLNQRKRQIDLQIKTVQDSIKNSQEQLKNLQRQKQSLV